jgi:hypothetical protein
VVTADTTNESDQASLHFNRCVLLKFCGFWLPPCKELDVTLTKAAEPWSPTKPARFIVA